MGAYAADMIHACRTIAFRVTLVPVSAAFLHCGVSSSASATGDGGACFSDTDGINGGSYTFALTVDDTGFSKTILAAQNDAQVTLTLTNDGTTPHGFKVGCTSVASAYPDLPAGCSSTSCFPASATITFVTPPADGLIYPFTSNEPSDGAVAGLSSGQFSVM